MSLFLPYPWLSGATFTLGSGEGPAMSVQENCCIFVAVGRCYLEVLKRHIKARSDTGRVTSILYTLPLRELLVSVPETFKP